MRMFNKHENRLNVFSFITLALLPLPVIISTINFDTTLKFSEEQKVDYEGTVLNVDMSLEDGTLTFEPENLTVKLEDKIMNIDYEALSLLKDTHLNYTTTNELIKETDVTSNLNLFTLDCYNGFMYITFMDELSSAIREVIVAKDIPEQVNTSGMNEYTDRIKEFSNELSVSSCMTSYDNSFIYYSDMIADGEIKSKTLSNRLLTLESELEYSDMPEQEELAINLNGVGTIKLSNIYGLKEAPGMYLGNQDGVLRLMNYNTDEPLVFITNINNESFMCNIEELLETNYENLYVHEGFDNPESTGYRTFALTSEASEASDNKSKIYVFRVSSEANEQTIIDLFNELRIVRENISVNVVQKVTNIE